MQFSMGGKDMRIKFRGKSVQTGEWFYGYLQKYQETHASRLCICAASIRTWKDALLYEVIPETIGQFIGISDSDGNEIYEGDIIMSDRNMDVVRHEVFYNEDEASFCAALNGRRDSYFGTCSIRKEWIERCKKRVVGNIHDNPELLKGNNV